MALLGVQRLYCVVVFFYFARSRVLEFFSKYKTRCKTVMLPSHRRVTRDSHGTSLGKVSC